MEMASPFRCLLKIRPITQFLGHSNFPSLFSFDAQSFTVLLHTPEWLSMACHISTSSHYTLIGVSQFPSFPVARNIRSIITVPDSNVVTIQKYLVIQ
jgi:hypothetical protein